MGNVQVGALTSRVTLASRPVAAARGPSHNTRRGHVPRDHLVMSLQHVTYLSANTRANNLVTTLMFTLAKAAACLDGVACRRGHGDVTLSGRMLQAGHSPSQVSRSQGFGSRSCDTITASCLVLPWPWS